MQHHWFTAIGITSVTVVVGVATLSVPPVFAHRSGCHNLHTCPSDSDTYVCGDLGYACHGATSLDDIPAKDIAVPLVIEATFKEIFGRVPVVAESNYWKQRYRHDKGSLMKVRRAMRWHKAKGSFGPPVVVPAQPKVTTPQINALFRAVYDGRNPTITENRYWVARLKDKPTVSALQGAMTWHRAHNIIH